MPKAKTFGVTFDKRAGKNKVQIFIAGKPRFFGYIADDKEAAQVAENARLHLQQFFPKPPPTTHKFEIVASTPQIENVRAALVEEKAPTFKHIPLGGETVSDEVIRLFAATQAANTTLQHCLRRLDAALNRK